MCTFLCSYDVKLFLSTNCYSTLLDDLYLFFIHYVAKSFTTLTQFLWLRMQNIYQRMDVCMYGFFYEKEL